MIQTQIKWRDNFSSLRNKIYRAIVKEIRAKYPNLRQLLEGKFIEIFHEEIRKSDTYRSLMTSAERSLAADFGFNKGRESVYVDPVVNEWESQRKVLENLPFAIRGGVPYGRLKMGFVESDLSKVLGLKLSWYYSKNAKTGEGSRVDWLSWLLTEGDKIFPNYFIMYKEFGVDSRSRSKEAVMIKTPKRVWQVNPVYSGIVGNNWISKVLDIVRVRLQIELQQILNK